MFANKEARLLCLALCWDLVCLFFRELAFAGANGGASGDVRAEGVFRILFFLRNMAACLTVMLRWTHGTGYGNGNGENGTRQRDDVMAGFSCFDFI